MNGSFENSLDVSNQEGTRILTISRHYILERILFGQQEVNFNIWCRSHLMVFHAMRQLFNFDLSQVAPSSDGSLASMTHRRLPF